MAPSSFPMHRRAPVLLLLAAAGLTGGHVQLARAGVRGPVLRASAPRRGGLAVMDGGASAVASDDADLDLDGWAQRWRVSRLAQDANNPERIEASPTEARWEALPVPISIARSRPGLGLLLVEAGATDGLGLVLVDGVAPGSNAAELPPGTVRRGDVLSAARVPGGAWRSVEGLPYDETVGVLGALDPAAGSVELLLKRQRSRPKLTVSLVYPQGGAEADSTVTLYSGQNLRRTLLAKGVGLNDPLARRFDAGIGTGDCGGEGCCCTCAVEVVRGVEALSPQGSQERQMLSKFPRWRLACKAAVGTLAEDAEITLKVTPRDFEGFYGKEEYDANGKPLYRGADLND